MFFKLILLLLACVCIFGQERPVQNAFIKFMGGSADLLYQPEPDETTSPSPLVSADTSGPTMMSQDVSKCDNKGILVDYVIGGNTTTACICPLDKVGDRCQTIRQYKCTDKLVSPVRNCPLNPEKLAGKEIEGDLPCLVFKSNDTIQFYLSITCEFTESPAWVTNNIPTNTTLRRVDRNITTTFESLQTSFSYYAISENTTNPTFALTNRINVHHEFRIVNFYTFSDTSMNLAFLLDKDHFVSGKLFGRNLWFGNISSEYFAGQRLYMEVGYPAVDGMTPFWERFNIDFSDLLEPEAPFPWNDTIKWTAVALAIAAALCILLVSLFCYFRNQKQKQKDLNKID